MYLQRTILGSAALSAVIFWLGGSGASTVPNSSRAVVTSAAYTSNATALPIDDPSPYQKGYEEGTAVGDARAKNYCDFIPPMPYTDDRKGAFWSGYSDGYYAAAFKGRDKYCHA
jgi:hypothetical protein